MSLAACLAACTGDVSRPPQEASPAAGVEAEAEIGAGPRFTDVTEEAGIRFRHRAGGGVKDYIVEAKGGGGALFDADGDGWLDLYLVNGGTLEENDPAVSADALYLNRRDGTFAETGLPAAAGEGWGMGASAADVDNDGDTDLVVTRLDGGSLYRNLGAQEPRYAADPGSLDLDGWCTGAAFGDYDLDGDLDLYVARYVDFDVDAIPPRAGMWKGLMVFAGPMGLPAHADALLRNDGGRFVEVSRSAGVAGVDPTYGLGVVFTDYDGDGGPDIYVANDSAPNYLFRNEGGGGGPRFREAAWEARAAFSAEGTAQAGMGIASGDYDGDGDGDLFVTHFEDDYNTLYRNEGGGRFTVASNEAGLAQVGLPGLAFGTCFLDADNDGDLDLVVGQGHVYPQVRLLDGPRYAQPDHLLLNLGAAAGHRFEPAPGGDLGQPGVTRGLMKGDWDEDGDVDLVAMRLDDRPALLRNDGPLAGHWLIVDLRGTAANRDAVGALVTVTAGGLSRRVEIAAGGSYLSHNDRRAHFGLGPWSTVDAVEVRWPGGGSQRLGPMAADRVVRIRQP